MCVTATLPARSSRLRSETKADGRSVSCGATVCLTTPHFVRDLVPRIWFEDLSGREEERVRALVHILWAFRGRWPEADGSQDGERLPALRDHRRGRSAPRGREARLAEASKRARLCRSSRALRAT